tara:strand:- start:4298 stop:4969 length:672 start_codon:yes stop_codon:yes gene_type:complete
VDLFAAAGESNLYPKHFAYFMPEDEGIKYAEHKRTIVFSNVYSQLFTRIALKQLNMFGWKRSNLPDDKELSQYLIGWFRGHDLGHSIVSQNTSFKNLSKLDRWGSMVVQEALADVFGLLICSSHRITDELQLDKETLSRVYLLEMLRYLRRGPCDFPDAGAAYIQFKFLLEVECLTLHDNGEISADLDKLYRSITLLAGTWSKTYSTVTLIAHFCLCMHTVHI